MFARGTCRCAVSWSVFAVVTTGKQLIRGSERIADFTAIREQTCRSPHLFSVRVHALKASQRTGNIKQHKRRRRKWAWVQNIMQTVDLMIPPPPRSIWLLLEALMGLERINLGDYSAATDTWGQGSWTSSAGRQKEKSCSWSPEETGRRANDSQRGRRSQTRLTLTKADCFIKDKLEMIR